MVNQLKSSERPLAKDRCWQIPPKPWRFLIVTVLVIGIFFRFAHLDHKPYWWDEVINSIHSAGYSKQDFRDQVEAWQDKELTIEDLHKYQYPTSETTSLDVIKALAEGEPQSPPVYYLLSRWWTQLFGSSVIVQRSLSACISLLAFPSMYWLCIELFGSSVAAWIGVTLIAISPFHLIFAQEVRMYALWTVTILVSSASLLRAIRLQRKRDWGIYAASLTLSLYTFPFSILVAISHGIYVAIAEVPKFVQSINRRSQARIKIGTTFFNYLISTIFSIFAYYPWMVLWTQIDETKMSNWRQITLPFSDLLKNWLLQTSLIFADFNPEYLGGSGGIGGAKSFYNLLSFYPMIVIWVFCLYSFYFIVRNSPKRIWSFILPLILTTPLALALPDLIFGGMRSTIARYLIPSYLGIQLSIVNLISTKGYFQLTSRVNARKTWQFILAILLSVGIISCSLIINSPSWWIKSINYQNIPIAEVINSSEKSLILTPRYSATHLISISHNLNNKVRIRFVDKPDINEISKTFSDQFLLNYPQKWIDSIEKENKFQIEKIYQGKIVEDSTSELNFNLVRIL